MARLNIISLYWLLSAVNGSIPAVIALLFSVSGLGFLLIWAVATLVTFTLICVTCLSAALKEQPSETEAQWAQSEIHQIPSYR